MNLTIEDLNKQVNKLNKQVNKLTKQKNILNVLVTVLRRRLDTEGYFVAFKRITLRKLRKYI
jgi:regulator of replication initiation timing